jgi:hypothetical protein
MHARQYAPLLGRFMSIDPILGAASRPQSWNRYSYVRNSPIRLVDPDGREPIDPAIARYLGHYFGQNVSHVQVFGGPLSRALVTVLSFGRAGAMTFGQRAFFRNGYWQHYKAKSKEGIALAGLEVRHTIQYKELVFFGSLLDISDKQSRCSLTRTGFRSNK